MRYIILLASFIEEHQLPSDFTTTVKAHYLPVAEQIYGKFKQGKSPLFVGINGCQGSGKSTFTDFIAQHLSSQYQLNTLVMSLDDFYLPSQQRKDLAESVHPLLATRGVPGTHDVSALGKTITKLKNQDTGFAIPKFNKATDEPFEQEKWQQITTPVDIIFLEGWCWGVNAQTDEQLQTPMNELEMQHDSKGQWRSYVNEQLKAHYQPLYQAMDYWIALQAPSFDCVYKWRLEQEEKLQARNPDLENSKIMTPAQILNFTQYFQRLSVQASNSVSQSADTIFYLDYDRKIAKMTTKEA